MTPVHCTHARHAEAILAIFNDAILTSTALYDYVPRPLSAMDSWFREKEAGRFPVIGLEAADGTLLGFATYGTFRVRPAYKYSIEHSVYVHKAYRGQGVGSQLLTRLIDEAVSQQYHTMVGGIDASNTGSIAFHERLGFVHCGTIREAGFKFGRWLDLAFYQRILPTPTSPVDG